ncbi:MAG: prenyltransferase/squalene oxidase repeat-containing protein [Kiritimatiellia bacterium]|jgi:squalene-hopene/tetraprenyl-beta-curcumene cyclase
MQAKRHPTSIPLALFLCLLAAMTTVGVAATPPAKDADAAIKQGVAWLAARQGEDGAISNPQFPGLTGLALWAIVGSGDPAYSNVVKKASDHILAKVQPDGGIYTPIPGRKGGGLGTYNTAVCLTALAATGRDDITEVVLNARTYLANSQHLGDDVFKGGFGYDKQTARPYADLMNTHFVVEAMRRTQVYEDLRPAGQPRADINWKAALDYATSLQNGPGTGDSEGGFAYNHGDAKAGTEKVPVKSDVPGVASTNDVVVLRSYGSITYAGLLALVYCDVDRDDPRVQSALHWASRHWTLDENPGMQDQGLYFFYNVISRALTAAGLQEIPRESGDAIPWAKELVDKVVSLSKDDGRWVNRNGRYWENDPVLATSYSVLALEFATGRTK